MAGTLRDDARLHRLWFDGLFQQALIRHLGGSEAAAGELQANTERILESLVTVG